MDKIPDDAMQRIQKKITNVRAKYYQDMSAYAYKRATDREKERHYWQHAHYYYSALARRYLTELIK